MTFNLFFRFFLPQDKELQKLAVILSDKITKTANLLSEEFKTSVKKERRILYEQIQQIEKECDTIVIEAADIIARDLTRVTEEKGDARIFFKHLDDIVDLLESIAFLVSISSILEFDYQPLISILQKAVKNIHQGVLLLKDLPGSSDRLAQIVKAIDRNEEAGDIVYRNYLILLLRVKTNISFGQGTITLKIIEKLEQALDTCKEIALMIDIFRLKGTF